MERAVASARGGAAVTGRQLLNILRRLPREELDLPVAVLLEQYDQPTCQDCGRHHPTPWAAFACDERIDARARRFARSRHRATLARSRADRACHPEATS